MTTTTETTKRYNYSNNYNSDADNSIDFELFEINCATVADLSKALLQMQFLSKSSMFKIEVK